MKALNFKCLDSKIFLKAPGYLLAMALVLVASCKGEDGEPGPAGVPGAQGPQGLQGAQGPQGENTHVYVNFFEDFSSEGIVPPISTEATKAWFVSSYSLHPGDTSDLVESFANNRAISAPINNNGSTAMSITVNMPVDGVLSFETIISCERTWDYLYWYLDDVLINGISGIGGPFTFNIPLTAGTHTFTWKYVKDHSNADGDDLGTVDNIIIMNYAEGSRLREPDLPSTVATLKDRGTGEK